MRVFEPGTGTLCDVLRWRAVNQPDDRACVFVRNGAELAAWTYGELDRRARAVAVRLQNNGATGQRVMLLCPPGLDYAAAFFGCLYAGAVAVPLFPPRASRRDARFESVLADATPVVALTTRAVVESDVPQFYPALHWVATDDLQEAEGDGWQPAAVGSDDLAFLQYTSGSTSRPKGVMVTHGNLIHNEWQIQTHFGLDEKSLICSWVPLFHDLGLIAMLLQAIYLGSCCVLMSPLEFLQHPLNWLAAISRYRAVFSAAPNFAYDLCVRRATPEAVAGLDLSCLSRAANAAEPVREETLERFSETFALAGFRPEAFLPCYGMAEATVFAAGSLPGRLPQSWKVDRTALERQELRTVSADDPGARGLIACGTPPAGIRLAVVDPETLEPCPDDRSGELWIAGPNIAQGYWNRRDATEQVFHARTAAGDGPFLRTGDLAAIRDGQLYIVGRAKDVIILRGQNHYPEDIEWTLQNCHPAIRPSGTAAFSDDSDGEERLIVAVETERLDTATADAVISSIRRALFEHHALSAHGILLLGPRAIPKTSSGKVQRQEASRLFREDGLTIIYGVLGEEHLTPTR